MCHCFCCDKKMRDDDMVPVPFLMIVICRSCEEEAFKGQKKFPRPDYGKAWAKAVENAMKRRR